MPTYEYRCTACEHEFEKFQRMSDEPVAECPECGARGERRISGGAGLLFKGEGFYITDYRGESYKKAAESEKGGGSAENKPSDAKSESKSSGTKPESSSSSSAKSE